MPVDKNKQFPSWCCQRCGDQIGYLGRLVEIIYVPFFWIAKSAFHNCPELFALPTKKVSQRKSYKGRNDFPIFDSVDIASNERDNDA